MLETSGSSLCLSGGQATRGSGYFLPLNSHSFRSSRPPAHVMLAAAGTSYPARLMCIHSICQSICELLRETWDLFSEGNKMLHHSCCYSVLTSHIFCQEKLLKMRGLSAGNQLNRIPESPDSLFRGSTGTWQEELARRGHCWPKNS